MPVIVLGDNQLRDLTSEALKALEGANVPKPRLFRFGPGVARIGHDDHGRPFTEPENETMMRYNLSMAATFIRYDSKGNPRDCAPPLDLCANILVAGEQWHFPSLLGIVEGPTLRPDFSVLDTAGYDPQTGLYFEPARGLQVPPIPSEPTDADLQDAVALVQEPLRDFLFVNEASKANMTAAILLSCIRDAITGPIPLTLVTKPQPGCGGSLLVDCVSIIATGRAARVVQAPREPEEWRKLLTSLLAGGDRYLIFDNVDRTLESEYLASFLTTMWWKDRILGQSAQVELPNRTVVFANGNNARVGGNLARRIVPVQLDSPGARVWMRDTQQFRHPQLREWVFENRGRIIAAILTILRAWARAGKPKADNIITLGSFESYCEVVGNFLSFMGVKKFLGNLEDVYSKIDVETPAWAQFFETWLAEVGAEPITVADLVVRVKGNSALKSALPASIYDTEGNVNTRRMGNQLAKREGQKFDNGLTLARAGEFRRAVKWLVVSFVKGQTHTNLASNVSLESSISIQREERLENQEREKYIRPEQNARNSQNTHDSRLHGRLTQDYSDDLGMPVDAAIELWTAQGMPPIQLAPGVSTEHLDVFLSRPGIPEDHLRAVAAHLAKRNGGQK